MTMHHISNQHMNPEHRKRCITPGTYLNVGIGKPCARHNKPNPSPELITNELLLSLVENLGTLAPTGSVNGQVYFTVLPE